MSPETKEAIALVYWAICALGLFIALVAAVVARTKKKKKDNSPENNT